MKLFSLLLMPLLMLACSKKEGAPPVNTDEQESRVHHFDGMYSCSEYDEDRSSGARLSFDTSFLVSVTITDTLNGGMWLRMPIMTMFPDHASNVYLPKLPAVHDTMLLVAAPGTLAGSYDVTPSLPAPRQIYVATNAKRDSLFFTYVYARIGDPWRRTYHHFAGRINF